MEDKAPIADSPVNNFLVIQARLCRPFSAAIPAIQPSLMHCYITYDTVNQNTTTQTLLVQFSLKSCASILFSTWSTLKPTWSTLIPTWSTLNVT